MKRKDIKEGMKVRARVAFGPTFIHMDGVVESINEEYGYVTLADNKGWATFDNIWLLEEQQHSGHIHDETDVFEKGGEEWQ